MDLDISNVSDSSRKFALNKSASFSGSPIAEKYEIKQLFKSKEGETIVRHYSYEIPDRRKPHIHQIHQLFKYTKPSKLKGKPILHSDDYNYTPYEGGIKKEVPSVKFGTPFKHLFNFAKHVPEEQGFEKSLVESNDCTPMDVDTSIGSNISICDLSKQNNNNLKIENDKVMLDVHNTDNDINEIEHKNKVAKLKKPLKPKRYLDDIKLNQGKTIALNSKTMEKKCGVKNGLLFRMFKILCFFLIPVTFGVLCMFCSSDSGFIESFETKPIVSELRRLIYGQPGVVDKLEYNLNLMNNNKVFIFTGGIGVGKTYTAQIIERNYPFKENIQKIIMNTNKQLELEKEITNNLVKNAHNLIIIDNLVADDIYYILPVVNALSEINALSSGTKFIVVLIFNVQELSEQMLPSAHNKYKGREISKIFYDNNIPHSTYIFDNLNEDDTKECIRYAILKRGLAVSEFDVGKVLENINYKYSGCKGVYSKVALLY